MATTTAPAEPGTPAEPAGAPLRQRLLSGSTLGPLAALIIACLFFAIRTDRFLSAGNFSLVIQQVMVVGTLAIGQTLIILTAGIDLSNGAIMAFGTIVMTKLAVEGSIPPVAAILIGILVCTGSGLARTLTALGETFTIGGTDVTYGSILTIALFLIFAYVLSQTSWGRHVYA